MISEKKMILKVNDKIKIYAYAYPPFKITKYKYIYKCIIYIPNTCYAYVPATKIIAVSW